MSRKRSLSESEDTGVRKRRKKNQHSDIQDKCEEVQRSFQSLFEESIVRCKQKSRECARVWGIRVYDSVKSVILEDTPLIDNERRIREIKDRAWMQIHCVEYRKVKREWRMLFVISSVWTSLITMMRTVVMTEEIPSDSEQKKPNKSKSALRELDLALMMGGPEWKDEIHDWAEWIHDRIIEEEESKQHPMFISHENRIIDNHHHSSSMIKITSPMDEVESTMLELHDFLEQWFIPKKPLLIRGLAKEWPCMLKWKQLSYLRSECGYRTVPVEVGKMYTETNWTQSLITMNEFMDEYLFKEEDSHHYLAQHQLFSQLRRLRKDIRIPEFCHVGSQDFDESGTICAWFGPSGTISPTHCDPNHNLFAQIIGSKYFRLYAPSEKTRLRPFSHSLHTNTSEIPSIDDPLLKGVPFTECVVSEGDVLFIPQEWWHYVRSLSVSFSVSFWFQ